ncbi:MULTISPECIES: hypothetical protein [Bradyrhizobium]|jgi:hypothetical protein|uniref:hypothetical protein n=1 Tax=Bradyrhizobium TaxID=374 RepID=UPI002012F735|nr:MULTISPECIES: hypothetical protein [Bradyrhizobium]WOH72275.1 hypothetical protein RX330_28910 [Bradyrhizobium sp. NDS-1]
MRRLRFTPYFITIMATSSLGVMADDRELGKQRSSSIVPDVRVECSLTGNTGQPFDPPTTSTIPQTEAFVAGKHFKENITPGARVKISWLGATFARRFAVKVEASTDDASLQAYVLRSPASDTEIIGELNARNETKLGDVWCLLSLQGNGESGALQIDSRPNVFFVRDGRGDLGVVDAIWAGAGWEIGASPIGDQRKWPRGARIFAR